MVDLPKKTYSNKLDAYKNISKVINTCHADIVKLEINDKNMVKSFKEKPEGDDSWINGGFFVLSKSIFKLIKNDKTFWEKEPLEKLASDGELVAYKHHGFWHACDTLRDKNHLEDLWNSNKAPWKVWSE